MLDNLIPIAFRVLETMFFVGAVGCVLTVAVSWIEIFAEGFSEDHPDDK
ncbi:MAG TPA: hypothetical protein VGI45_34180 [Terracidiphilus sp.]